MWATALVWPQWVACTAVDRQPPMISVEGPAAPSPIEATFQLEASDASGLAHVLVSFADGRSERLAPADTDQPRHEVGLTHTLGLESLGHGSHEITFTAVDASWLGNRARRTVRLTVDREPPQLQVARMSRLVGQGRTLPIWVQGDEPLAEGEAEIFGRTHPLFPVDGAWRALVGVEIRQQPGPVPLRIVARDRAGNRAVLDTEVLVEPTDFEDTGPRDITRRDIDEDREPADVQATRRARDEAYARTTPDQHWSGPMGLPVAYGRAAAPFGQFFSYRDGERSYHTGMDLEKRPGARISAAAAGTVTLATTQPIFGKVVILDHGHGVSTCYNHLDTVDVDVGEQVRRGQGLGTMGATGQAYGPHLHWVVVVGQTAVEPGDWLEDDYATAPF